MSGRISYLGGIVKNGLILDLDAAKQDSYPRLGTSWKDISGNGNNGILTNGPTFNSGNGGNIVFDGINDYVNLGDIFNYTNNFTINSWIKVSGNTIHPIISKWSSNVVSNRFFLLRTNNNILEFFDSNSVLYTRGTVYDNIYTNVSFVINGSNSQMYINGLPSGTVFNPTLTIKTGLNLGLACYSVSLNNFLNGSISINMGYNRALSASEILQNYNATKGRYL